ncbi:MAG TPA: L-threonylcarbamoyladenylate synthase [Saprospiraceae bacterium]|nr:L-threonylcarbamoyladenylate synthase [Saprospiraceae bacterium]
MIGTDINFAASVLKRGGLVGIPTETVYGLAGNALDEQSVLKIFTAKNRPHFDPLILHFADFSVVEKYVEFIPDIFQAIAIDHSPGPITFLLKKKPLISDLVTSGSDLVAVRIPNHKITLSLLSQLDFPLAAPSANPFGYISPTTAKHVEKQLGDKIDYILDGGPCDVGLESTIISLDNDGSLVIHRKGGLEIDSFKKYGLPISIKDQSTSNPSAPGMLLSHYAPRKKLYLGNLETLAESFGDQKVAILAFSNESQYPKGFLTKILSPEGDLRAAAKNVFSYLRLLDEDEQIAVIIAEEVPDQGLGLAINDRLRRAAF